MTKEIKPTRPKYEQMITTIYFDLDGVLTLNSSGTEQTGKYISEATKIDYNTLLQAFRKHTQDQMLGYRKYTDILPEINSIINYQIDDKMLEKAFMSTPKNQKMFDIANHLKQKGLKIGIITDNPLERFHALDKKFNLKNTFDSITVSSEVHSSKKEEKIFKIALESLNTNPEEAIFIDNSEKNLETAKKLCIHAINHDDKDNDTEKLIQKLKQLNIY